MGLLVTFGLKVTFGLLFEVIPDDLLDLVDDFDLPKLLDFLDLLNELEVFFLASTKSGLIPKLTNNREIAIITGIIFFIVLSL
ncbi:hypothetical protein D3C76_162790 [compost metagenome]